MTLNAELSRRIYTDMWRIRLFEEEALRQTSLGSVKGTLHTYCGEEAIAVAVCAHLRDDDYVLGTHRSHGHCLAKGAPMDRMMAELFGRATGSCRAKGGSMHIADFSRNILGANGIVAGGIGPGTGTALASRIRKSDQVSVVFFGDGAAARGPFHEGLLFGSLWKLPVIYVCENNGYQQWVPRKNVAVVDSVAPQGCSACSTASSPARSRGCCPRPSCCSWRASSLVAVHRAPISCARHSCCGAASSS